MAWVIGLAAAVAFAVVTIGITVAPSRRPHLDGSPLAPHRTDLPRSGLAALAAALAAIAGFSAILDETIESRPWTGLLLVATAVCAAGLALWPGGGAWDGRRVAAGLLAGLWFAFALAALPFAIMVGCSCGSAVRVDPLGVSARTWILMATFAGPVLLVIAASPLPGRLGRGRSHTRTQG